MTDDEIKKVISVIEYISWEIDEYLMLARVNYADIVNEALKRYRVIDGQMDPELLKILPEIKP